MRKDFLTLGTKSKEIFFNNWPQYEAMKDHLFNCGKLLDSRKLKESERIHIKKEIKSIEKWLEDNKELKP